MVNWSGTFGERQVNPGIGGGLRNLTAGFIRLCSAEAVSRSLRSRLPRMVATPVKEFEDTLWKAADKLRGSMDDSQYKDIVLGLVFLKYVTDAFDDARRLELEAEMQAEGASAEGKRGGEFYTPRSLVRTLVEILEPTEGRVYETFIGSGAFILPAVERLLKSTAPHSASCDELRDSVFGIDLQTDHVVIDDDWEGLTIASEERSGQQLGKHAANPERDWQNAPAMALNMQYLYKDGQFVPLAQYINSSDAQAELLGSRKWQAELAQETPAASKLYHYE